MKYFGVPRPPESYTIGSKRGNTLHTQLRNEMSQLNSHLFKTKLTESPACPCSSDTESARHFILSCPLYTNQRNQLFCELNQTLHYNLRQTSKNNQQAVLIHGTSLNSGEHLPVARSFQKLLKNSHRFGP